MLRSMLFTPGTSEKKMEKALQLEVDALIFDLEDAVAVSEKPRARGIIAEYLGRSRGKRKAYVRVNAISTGFLADDLDAVVIQGLDGILLPKVEAPEEIHITDWYLSVLEGRRNLKRGCIDLLPLIETSKGVVFFGELARAARSVGRVRRFGYGAVDYTADIGVSWSGVGTELFYARTKLVNDSKAFGLEPPIDSVYPNIQNREGFEAEVDEVRRMGFQGKFLIHPGQIEAINRAFSPSQAEVEWARKVVAAFEEAEAKGLASITIDGGKFVDYPVVANARRILSAIGEDDGSL